MALKGQESKTGKSEFQSKKYFFQGQSKQTCGNKQVEKATFLQGEHTRENKAFKVSSANCASEIEAPKRVLSKGAIEINKIK